MSQLRDLNFRDLYDAFDGTMSGCLGAKCPKPCCNLKEVGTWEDGRKTYNTTLDRDELEYQKSLGPFPEGVQIERADTGMDGPPRISYLVRGCLAADGKCRLDDRKPLQCRTFPFSTVAWFPLRDNCPQADIIGADPTARSGVEKIRILLGAKDNEQWGSNLVRMIEQVSERRNEETS